MMLRKFLTLAVVALSFAAGPVIAGGGGGGGAKGGIPVRMKNVGSAPVSVNAASGSVPLQTLINGSVTVASNGVAQFSVRQGGFVALAADPNQPLVTNSVRGFDTRAFKTLYLYAQQDTTRATLVGAPGGVKF